MMIPRGLIVLRICLFFAFSGIWRAVGYQRMARVYYSMASNGDLKTTMISGFSSLPLLVWFVTGYAW